MKTINIKGNDYVTVNERLKYFRENFAGYKLISDIVKLQDGMCVIKASILDTDDKEVASGHAYEKENSTFINKTSFIENCETSAWGRALANFGIGIDSSVASADEVANAISQQNDKPEPLDREIVEKFKKCETLEELQTLWQSLDNQSPYKKLKDEHKLRINKDNVDNMIKGLRSNSKTRPMIEEVIQKTNGDKKKELIKQYNEKLAKLGIDEQYQPTPFEEGV